MSDSARAASVGVVTHNVDPGGAQRIAICEARHLAERGYDVTLLSMVRPRDPWRDLLAGVDLRYLVDVGGGALGEGVSRVASGFARLPDDFDAVVCHNLPGAHLGHRARRRDGTPYVAYVHDATAYPIAGSPLSLFFGRYSPDVEADGLGFLGRRGLAMERRWLRGATAVVANSTRTARELEERHGVGVDVLYPTLVGNAAPDPTPAWDADYFLVVQRLEPHPTYDVVAGLLDRVDDLRVVVAGSSAAAYLERGVRQRFDRFGDRVRFRVDPSDAELARLYADAYAFLHPGVENFNMSAMEAAAAERPLVLAAESGVTELFDDYPLFVPAGDLAGFERAVRRLLDDPAAARRFGREAAAVTAAYDETYHVEALESVLVCALEEDVDG